MRAEGRIQGQCKDRSGEDRNRIETENQEQDKNNVTKCSNGSLEAQLLITRHLVVTVAAWWTGTRWGHNCTNNKAERKKEC